MSMTDRRSWTYNGSTYDLSTWQWDESDIQLVETTLGIWGVDLFLASYTHPSPPSQF